VSCGVAVVSVSVKQNKQLRLSGGERGILINKGREYEFPALVRYQRPR